MTRRLLVITLTIALFWLPPSIEGQSAGGWVRERIGLLSLEGPPGSARAVRALGARAGGILSQVESSLGARPAGRFTIALIPASGPGDSAWAAIDESAPPWAAGYMIPARRIGAIRIARAAQYPYGTVESVFAHEATHLLLHDLAAGRLPLWFEEGVATWQGRRWSPEDMWIYARSVLTADAPRLAELSPLFHASAAEAEVAYAASFAFVSWSTRRHGPDLAARVLRALRSSPSFDAAWQTATGSPLAEDEETWRRESLIRYRWIPLIVSSSTLWIVVGLLAAVAGVRRRARARAARERWMAEEDAAESETPPAPPETRTPSGGR